MCEQFLGRWTLVQNNKEDFENYMVALDVALLTRKAACTLKPDVIISMQGDVICLKTESCFKNHEIKFKLGEVFDEQTADGRNTKTTITMDDGVMKQVQQWDCKETVITREVKGEEMIVTCTMGNVKCIRIYNKK
ncbi:fatty acid-binding protein, adipocyte-like [Pelodytes ibericus]